MKARLGKLPGAADVAADVAACVAGQGFLSLDITLLHAQRAGRLPGTDRIHSIACSSRKVRSRTILLVSDDEVFDAFDVRRFW